MKTKALLLAAAFAAVGAATSMAQVYSVNAVGYVNVTLKPGFTMVSNPLKAANNSVNALFSNIQGGVPQGTTVYRFANNNFVSYTFDDLDGFYSPQAEAASTTVVPGEGVFVKIPVGSGNKVLTFVGEVVQGGSVSIPAGFSIRSSIVPQDVKPDAAKNTDGTTAVFPVTQGNVLYTFDTTLQNFKSYTYDDLDGFFTPALPTIKVGESFFYLNQGAAGTWTRTFSVNNPS
jgi:hypothetical protein